MTGKFILFFSLLLTSFSSGKGLFIIPRTHEDNSLKSIAEKWDGNTNFNDSKYENLDEPCIDPDGSPDYVDYSSQNYYQYTSFNRITYFQNLSKYSAKNSVGSCGYVSLIQAMSYYDTFYNDNIIPEQYDRKDVDHDTENSVKSVSPGVLNQPYYTSYGTYYQFCHDTIEDNFQSKLTVIRNQIDGFDNDGSHSDDSGTTPNFLPSIGGWKYQSVLDDFYSDSEITVSVTEYTSKTNSEFINIIKDIINNGDPAIVHILKYDPFGNQTGYHSVVAYEYDEGGIYANYGWGSYSTHYQLLGGATGYSKITQVYTLDYTSNKHVHSDNYVFNSKSHCGCNLSDEILFNVPPTFKNIPPTFYWMMDVYDSNEYFNIYIRNGNSIYNIVSLTTSSNKLTLSRNQWQAVINNTTDTISFVLKRNKANINYAEFKTIKVKPQMNAEHFTISPSEYGYEDAYPATEVEKTITQGNVTFNTKRLRCGYIQNEVINLSPRKLGAGLAYLEFNFDIYVYAIDVDISMWSDNEMTSSADSTGYIQFKNSYMIYENIIDLYNIGLSLDRTNQDHLVFTFPVRTKSFRFYTTAPAIGDRNKGRISIGDLTVYYKM
jgi:hypothetical protein